MTSFRDCLIGQTSIWQKHENFPISDLTIVNPLIKKLSHSLGVLSIVGLTAYFGIVEVSKIKPGETILISSAAGGVGSLAGQIAKILGAKVIGLTSSQEKMDFIVKELGFDGALNYRSPSFANDLKEKIPGGPDVYFDNVGGSLSQIVMSQMRRPARITECGQISTYSDQNGGWTMNIMPIHSNGLRFEGYQPLLFIDQFPVALGQLIQWVDEGKLKVIETEWKGLESASKAMVAMFSGKGVGKHIVNL